MEPLFSEERGALGEKSLKANLRVLDVGGSQGISSEDQWHRTLRLDLGSKAAPSDLQTYVQLEAIGLEASLLRDNNE